MTDELDSDIEEVPHIEVSMGIEQITWRPVIVMSLGGEPVSKWDVEGAREIARSIEYAAYLTERFTERIKGMEPDQIQQAVVELQMNVELQEILASGGE